MLLSAIDRDWIAEVVERSAEEEGHLELEVHQLARAEHRRLVVVGPRLAARTADRSSGHDDGTAAAVVADRQVLPVRHQRVLLSPEKILHF